jgi:hypothetical protein
MIENNGKIGIRLCKEDFMFTAVTGGLINPLPVYD